MSGDRPLVALGVTGGIACYKACDLVRRLRDAGLDVKVVMTRHAQEFVRPLTFETLSGHAVVVDQFQSPEDDGITHIGLARRAALLMIAPATANVIGKLAHGIADDFLTTMALATEAPILLAPAMNPVMWASAPVRENLRILGDRGVETVAPAEGVLACGEEGPGRMAEVPDLVEAASRRLARAATLAGARVLVNAGPTREPIDDVRFLSNRSSGRMGIALAAEARRRGADVTLVLGPTELAPPAGVAVRRVTTAAQMLEATLGAAAGCDVAVLAAAVSDFAPREPAAGKVKKGAAALSIPLGPTPDVLATLASTARPTVLVGFAAEHGDPEAEALRKCRAKGCDFVVGNDVSAAGSGFESVTNRAVICHADGRVERLDLMSKESLAAEILGRAADVLRVRRTPSVSAPATRDLG